MSLSPSPFPPIESIYSLLLLLRLSIDAAELTYANSKISPISFARTVHVYTLSNVCTYYIVMSLAYSLCNGGGSSTLSNHWWMAGAGHFASLRGTGVGHYETAATRSLQRQSCQPKVGLSTTHQRN